MSEDINNEKSSSLEIKSHNKGKLTKRILLALFSVFVAEVMTACSLLPGKSSPAAPPSPTPTAVATQAATPQPTPEQVYDNGDEFIDELKEKGYKYLINGDQISFGKTEAENLFRLLDGQQEKVFAGLEGPEKEKEIQKYQQAILIYVGECIDPDVKEVANITEKCKNLSEEELKAVNTLLEKGRKLAVLSKDEPINAKVLNSPQKTGNFSDEYVEATRDFIKAQKELEKIGILEDMRPWLEYLSRKLDLAVFHTYVPAYLTENAADPQSYNMYYVYTDENGKEIRLNPIMTEKGTKYKSEETGEEYTEYEMESCSDKNSSNYIPSMRAVGFTSGEVNIGESQIVDVYEASEEASKEIYDEAFSVEKVKTKQVNP